MLSAVVPIKTARQSSLYDGWKKFFIWTSPCSNKRSVVGMISRNAIASGFCRFVAA